MFYEVIDDITADAGIRVRAKSLEELVCKAILATFYEITNPDDIQEDQRVKLEVQSEMPFLLADAINKLLTIFESKLFVPKSCRVLSLDEKGATVELRGGSFDPDKHERKLVIKAATYHRLRVEKEGDNYVAEVIFDI